MMHVHLWWGCAAASILLLVLYIRRRGSRLLFHSTAESVSFIRACGALNPLPEPSPRTQGGLPIGRDIYAVQMLPFRLRLLLRISFIRLYFKDRVNQRMDGLFTLVNIRTVFYDRVVSRALENPPQSGDRDLRIFPDPSYSAGGARIGAKQFLVLGAGFDTRHYRLIAPFNELSFASAMKHQSTISAVRTFEVDLPDLQQIKRAQVRSRIPRALQRGVTFIETNFKEGDLVRKLEAAGWDRSIPSVCIWEGVTPYLNGEAVAATLKAIADITPPQSIVAFCGRTAEYIRRGGETAEYVKQRSEPYGFGIDVEELADLVRLQGFQLRSVLIGASLRAAFSQMWARSSSQNISDDSWYACIERV